MFLLHAIIFSTGGAILALELLASRIMTPYFGVSIYIWTGILSITLIALAAGYWCGGLVTHARRKPSIERLAHWYLAQPAWAGLAIVGACLVYPYAFHSLASLDLVIGAFVACMVLLFLPLLTTSAMNPLLVAIMTQASRDGSTAAAAPQTGTGQKAGAAQDDPLQSDKTAPQSHLQQQPQQQPRPPRRSRASHSRNRSRPAA
jgi:hypothetical protein